MTDWKPIETAPTDGSLILVFVPREYSEGGYHVARFEHRSVTMNGAVVVDEKVWREVTAGDLGFNLRAPTHWAALKPPKAMESA